MILVDNLVRLEHARYQVSAILEGRTDRPLTQQAFRGYLRYCDAQQGGHGEEALFEFWEWCRAFRMRFDNLPSHLRQRVPRPIDVVRSRDRANYRNHRRRRRRRHDGEVSDTAEVDVSRGAEQTDGRELSLEIDLDVPDTFDIPDAPDTPVTPLMPDPFNAQAPGHLSQEALLAPKRYRHNAGSRTNTSTIQLAEELPIAEESEDLKETEMWSNQSDVIAIIPANDDTTPWRQAQTAAQESPSWYPTNLSEQPATGNDDASMDIHPIQNRTGSHGNNITLPSSLSSTSRLPCRREVYEAICRFFPPPASGHYDLVSSLVDHDGQSHHPDGSNIYGCLYDQSPLPIPPAIQEEIRQMAMLTTHPDVFEPALNICMDRLAEYHLPRFISLAIRNVGPTLVRKRMIPVCIFCALALISLIVMLFIRIDYRWRILPTFVFGFLFFCILSNITGMCALQMVKKTRQRELYMLKIKNANGENFKAWMLEEISNDCECCKISERPENKNQWMRRVLDRVVEEPSGERIASDVGSVPLPLDIHLAQSPVKANEFPTILSQREEANIASHGNRPCRRQQRRIMTDEPVREQIIRQLQYQLVFRMAFISLMVTGAVMTIALLLPA